MQTITLQDISDRLAVLTTAVLSNKNALNLDEAAAFTGLTASTIYKLTSTQQIPHYKPRGKMLYFDRAELESWLLSRRVKPIDEIEQAATNHIVGTNTNQHKSISGGAK
ncbi:helix-turn-helix domain-containing protein [Methylomonas sp. AM2-LC]|uniref:helix-turn-helix domain-containing protein n=1 Tax=Methylomonas sp. AM2-LC TaxID=3153301 RepID=UPI0032641D0A